MTVKGVNLIPGEVRAGWRLRKIRLGLAAGAGLFIAVLGLVYAGELKSIGEKKAELAALEAQRERLMQSVASYRDAARRASELKTAEEALKKRLSAASEFTDKRLSWALMLKRLSHETPASVWLKSVSTVEPAQGKTEKLVKISGSALTNKGVGEFIFRLENSGYLSGVELTYSQRREADSQAVYDFEVAGTVKRSGLLIHDDWQDGLQGRQ